MAAGNQEQLTGTEATISCVVSGLTKALNGVTWKTSGGVDVTTGKAGFTSKAGDFVAGTKSQTPTLTVAADQNKKDDTYVCIVSSTEHGVTDQSTTVHLKIFSKYYLLLLEEYILRLSSWITLVKCTWHANWYSFSYHSCVRNHNQLCNFSCCRNTQRHHCRS